MIRVVKRFSSKNTSTLLRAQLDINYIIQNKNLFESSIKRRGLSSNLLANLNFIITNRPIQADINVKINNIKKERDDLSVKLKQGININKDRLKEIKLELKPLEKELNDLENNLYIKAESLPNLIDDSVPEEPLNEQVVKFLNCNSESDALTSLPPTQYDHKSIMEAFNIVDFNVASRISGSSWYFLIGDGALLEQALIQYTLKKARRLGYKFITPPSIVKSEIINACGFKPNDNNNEKQIYQIEDENKSLTGTAEIPLGAFHSSTIFESGTKFPIKYVGISRSYRAEAGSSGKDTKGLYRVHEFTKVELFHFTTLSKSKQELQNLLNLQIDMINDLNIKAKVLNMPSSDLGSPAMKKYDIEAWMPGKQAWGELTSCSNCGDYQSRRLGIRYNLDEGEIVGKKAIGHVATLNGTAMAIPRVIIAIIEQNYDPVTNRIKIPKVLQPYMDDKEYIVPN
ncbi:unnamed protein product [Candida verbasci]|uniref:serine--tRNA ligase n=1 Tax=Candida verbasci TaxID=1227364 RepID=A0A9W4U2G1_9ASCO|nr:unnamed protein product [Candida verbasci]